MFDILVLLIDYDGNNDNCKFKEYSVSSCKPCGRCNVAVKAAEQTLNNNNNK